MLSELIIEIANGIFPDNENKQAQLEDDIIEGRITLIIRSPEKITLVFHNDVIYFTFIKDFKARASGYFNGDLKGWVLNFIKEDDPEKKKLLESKI
jgi:hypothetical protein